MELKTEKGSKAALVLALGILAVFAIGSQLGWDVRRVFRGNDASAQEVQEGGIYSDEPSSGDLSLNGMTLLGEGRVNGHKYKALLLEDSIDKGKTSSAAVVLQIFPSSVKLDPKYPPVAMVNSGFQFNCTNHTASLVAEKYQERDNSLIGMYTAKNDDYKPVGTGSLSVAYKIVCE